MLKYTVKKYCAEGSKINQVVMATLMVLPVFSYGTAVGWLSPMGPRLKEDKSLAADVSDDVISWMASVAYLVGTPAVFLFGYIVDNYGRKKALMLTSFSMALCWALKLCSTSTWALITARALVGLGVSGSYVVTPLYIKEISEDTIRGTLGSLVVLSQNLGNLLVYVMGEYLSYSTVLWICLAVPLVHLIAFCSMPETPSYLLKCGKVEEARNALAWLRCCQGSEGAVDAELRLLVGELQQNKGGRFLDTIKTLVSDRCAFRAFRIILTITLARELCGCLAVLHFASLIFEQAGQGAQWVLSVNQQAAVLGAVQLVGSCTASTLVERTGRKITLARELCGCLAVLHFTSLIFEQAGQDAQWVFSVNQQAAVLGAVQLVGSCTASTLVERTGRKPLLAGTCLASGVAMSALGGWLYAGGGGWLPVAALCLCVYCDAAGLQPVVFVIMTEMFSFQLRGTVTTLVIAFACALVSVQLRLFQPLAQLAGLYTVFWLFAAVCIISTVYIVLWVPETKMRSIDEIYAQIGGKTDRKEKDCEAVTRL